MPRTNHKLTMSPRLLMPAALMIGLFSSHPVAATTEKQALVCIYGLLARSFIRTQKSIQQHVLEPLARANFTTTVYFFDIQFPKGARLDGVVVNEEPWFTRTMAWKFLPNAVYESVAQGPEFDEIIQSHCSKLPSCSFRYDLYEGYPQLTHNALRAMYAEARAARFIKTRTADLVVSFLADVQFVRDLPIPSIPLAPDSIYMTDLNDGEGYTNGFYMGAPTAVAAVLGRFDEYEHYAMLQRDYERTVMAAPQHHHITRVIVDMPFCKIRRNGDLWAGPKFPQNMMPACHLKA